MVRKLGKNFFDRPTLQVSKDLLGKFIVRVWEGQKIVGMITETEAYIGPNDRSAHSFLPPEKRPQKWNIKFEDIIGKHIGSPRENFEKWAKTGAKITPRNIAEYLDGGTIYIYLVYGMYWNVNLSTVGPGVPECVLLRGIVPVPTEDPTSKEVDWKRYKEANGPGKLCNYFHLDKSFYGKNVADSKEIWLEDRGIVISPRKIKKGPRIGIDYAGPKWAAKPWRFWIQP